MPLLHFPPDFDAMPSEERAVLERVAKRRGTTLEQIASGGITGGLSHWPAFLEATENQTTHTFHRTDGIPRLTKEAMHVAVSMSNGCDYWLTAHSVAVMRLGMDERGITEILALAEHVTSISAVAAGMDLQPDLPSRSREPGGELVAPLDEHAAEGQGTLAEIRAWSGEALGMDRAPAYWRLLARRPRLLDAQWQLHRLAALSAGRFDETAKTRLAFAVALDKGSRYWTSYFAALGRRSGALDDETILEIVGLVLHFVAFNTRADALRLEPAHSDLDSRNLPT